MLAELNEKEEQIYWLYRQGCGVERVMAETQVSRTQLVTLTGQICRKLGFSSVHELIGKAGDKTSNKFNVSAPAARRNVGRAVSMPQFALPVS